MKYAFALIMYSLIPILALAQPQAQTNLATQQLALMPLPAQIHFIGEKFRLNDQFKIDIRGKASGRLYRAATRILRRLSGRTGLFFPQDVLRSATHIDSTAFLIHVKRVGKLTLGEDESYRLLVSSGGIKLTATTDIGALRGLETFLQLLSVDPLGYYFPGVDISDHPRFPWRGLLIDASRHFMPVEVIKRNLDGMAAVKLNVFHWHLSDDQGFRVESKIFPRLHKLGSDGHYYTQAQIREVVAFAADRGIRVIPEFDVPGHATSWLVAYPELASAPGPYSIERKWGIFYPLLNPAKKFTYQFLDKFFGEMAALFPDPYFHIGGDEIEHEGGHVARDWNQNPEIQAFKKRKKIPDNASLQAYFNKRVLKILTRHGKKMVGWDEILNKAMPNDIVIQSWRGRDSMIKAARKGYRSILSNGYYIDLIYPASQHYLNDPLPADTPLSEEEQKRILGGEATMWSEFVSPETIDSRIWPRTAAIAERLWSPREVRDVHDMYRRLDIIALQLEELGLTHEKNYPMMLRRLARSDDIEPLKNLVDVIEPVKHYNRGQQRAYTSFSPLTRVVDAARPDAKIAREFRALVDAYISSTQKDSEQVDQIKHWLILWKNNHSRLLSIIQHSPVLLEIQSLSEDLATLSDIGLSSLELLEKNQHPSAAWVQKSLAAIARAKLPRGQTELMVVEPIEKLVTAVNSR